MRLLITGGAGSIGSEFARARVAAGDDVRVMDICEEALWSLKAELPQIDARLGDVQWEADCRAAVQDVDAIVHCAAVKHVDLCEREPRVADRVNVYGTGNLCRAARDGMRIVFVSTDKALQPAGAMGKSKAAAEAIVLSKNGNVVRFGNVIGTRGSLLPMVLRCKELGRPIPLTDVCMTRWFMTSAEAVALIAEALNVSNGGLTFTPSHPRACNVSDFVHACRDALAPGLEIVTVGMRPGERVHEPMQLRSGPIAWSNDERFAMSSEEMTALIEACAPVECMA